MLFSIRKKKMKSIIMHIDNSIEKVQLFYDNDSEADKNYERASIERFKVM